MDAGTSKIAIDLDIMTRRLGYEVILQVHPPFPALFKELQIVRRKIVASRRNRRNREAIYSAIEAVDFPALVEKYNALMADEEMMKSMAKKRRRSELIGIVGAALGIIGLVVAFLTWYFPRDPSSSPPPSTKSNLLVPKKQ